MDTHGKHLLQPYSAAPRDRWRSGVVVCNETGGIAGRFSRWRDAVDMATAMNLIHGRNAH